MATAIQSTDLDFDTIKTKLKDYFKRQEEFNDYDFEASGLSNILDVLAYNTHFNGLTANFALNESFLNTAQLRSSIISHAEALGYVPRSYTSAQAKLNISISLFIHGFNSSVLLDTSIKAYGHLKLFFQLEYPFTPSKQCLTHLIFILKG